MTESERQALVIISRGRSDNGRPLAGAEAQAVAREALIVAGADWTKPNMAERLGKMLAKVTDAVLLTVQDVANSRDVDLTLGSFRKDLGEACAALLEEAGY